MNYLKKYMKMILCDILPVLVALIDDRGHIRKYHTKGNGNEIQDQHLLYRENIIGRVLFYE